MSFVVSLIEAGATRLGHRFASRQSRFRTAISGGFVIVAVGSLVLGGERVGIAQSLFGLDLFGGGGSLFGQPAAQPQAASAWPRVRHRIAFDRRHARPMARVAAGPSERAIAQPVALARQSVCVRLCDGFTFPVGAYHGEGDRPAHEATCQSQCPGALTALYVIPVGGDTVGKAVRVTTGQSYSALPDAFHYTTVLSDACSCHPQGGSRIKSLLRDFTLRRGDAVMTGRGLQVFHGGEHYPFTRKDFMTLAQSPDVRKGDRTAFHAIERASLKGASGVAEALSSVPLGAEKPRDTRNTRNERGKLLEQQASR